MAIQTVTQCFRSLYKDQRLINPSAREYAGALRLAFELRFRSVEITITITSLEGVTLESLDQGLVSAWMLPSIAWLSYSWSTQTVVLAVL